MKRTWAWLQTRHVLMSILRWFDDEAGIDQLSGRDPDRVDWLRVVPFLSLHAACLLVIWVGWSPVAVGMAIGLYAIRMLAITGVYHRYFSHRTYKMSRFWQFLGAVVASTSAQRGPIWWAGHHRHHHRYADQPEDIHSPVQKGFLWSHVLWILTPKHFATNRNMARDLARYPELALLNRYSIVPPLFLLGGLLAAGEFLRIHVPSAGTSGVQMAVWGFCISTVALFTRRPRSIRWTIWSVGGDTTRRTTAATTGFWP